MAIEITEYKDDSIDYILSRKYEDTKTKKYIRKTEGSSNCQLSMIGLAYILLKMKDNKELIEKMLEYSKPLLLLDIKTIYRKDLEKLFLKYNYKKYKSMNYISTNGSEMSIIMLKRINK